MPALPFPFGEVLQGLGAVHDPAWSDPLGLGELGVSAGELADTLMGQADDGGERAEGDRIVHAMNHGTALATWLAQDYSDPSRIARARATEKSDG